MWWTDYNAGHELLLVIRHVHVCIHLLAFVAPIAGNLAEVVCTYIFDNNVHVVYT